MAPARLWTTPAVVLGIVLACGPVASAGAHAQATLSLKDVMKRVEAYVASYGEKASIVVCTERYNQQAQGSGMSVDTRRALVSDFAIVKADTIRGWLGFRDVLEVDGHRVSDREDRLARVLMASQGRYDEARQLSDESARYNVGAIERNFNVPTAALFFFTRENHDRFKFAARTVAGDGTWEITFRETGRPTLIRKLDGAPVPSSGTIWADPETGTIVRTLLQVETIADRGARAQHGQGHVDVVYRHVDELSMWLPASMDEQFEVSRNEIFDRVLGHAEYSNYRQFTTSARIK
jgi:hypothetical protein